MMRFLGMLNYDRLFIPKLSERIKPLYALLQNPGNKLKWDHVTNDIFENVKKIWANNLENVMPDMSKDFILESDASLTGIGAVLKQDNATVAYISRVLKGAEKNYTVTERETQEALWAMEKFEFYLIGRKFLLISDHKALEQIHQKKDFGTPRIQRWLERFAKFDFSVCYREGSKLIQADALSRHSMMNNMDQNDFQLQNIVIKLHKSNGHRKKHI
ncbi:Retrovirus-related Pol polyprotein from transposon [Dictyocoela roeselum]|nr:Retrovirus-related Pol polyprotein from transposon [Dictyocoela roeselum]